jgi:hypothetical protein
MTQRNYVSKQGRALPATPVDDQAVQEQVWDSAQEWQRQPQALRRALTETKVDASSDRRTLLVGIEAYTQAGGQIERDLFQPQHEGYLTDTALLERLVAEKLANGLEARLTGQGLQREGLGRASQCQAARDFAGFCRG